MIEGRRWKRREAGRVPGEKKSSEVFRV